QLKIKNDTIRLQYQVDRQMEKVRQVGSWQWNLNTGEITWGESMFHLFGQEPFSINPTVEWFVGLIHAGDQDKMMKTCQEVKYWPDNNLPPVEFRAVVNNEVRYFRSASRKISNGLGDYLVGSTIDFTEDALLHKRLAERMNFVEALIESSVDRIMAFDNELRILAWNKRCEDTYGYKKEEVIGKSYLDLFPKIRENPVVMSALNTAIQGQPVYVPVQKAYYTTGFVEGHYIPIKIGDDENYGLLNIIHDVTERITSEHDLKELNESLSQKNKELQEMNEELASQLARAESKI
ncbi:MAG TPA: PAS domain S-box protein, partial [Chitinophagaceae bacterium]|nr:PAS domain S-box protein [Chitinophagaceae bacterium]